MKLGIGGRLGPVRLGVSTRGIGGGIGPLSVGTSWGRRRSRGGGDSGFWALLGVILVVVWPYFLGTWIAVQSGAVVGSTASSVVGWSLEAAYVVAVCWWLISRTANANRVEQMLAAEDHRRTLPEAAQASRDLAQRLRRAPTGVSDPTLPAGQRLLVRFEGAALVEPRVEYRGGPRVPTTVSIGTVTITNQGVTFINTTKTTKWLFGKILDWNRGSNYATFHVSNRQLISGVGVGAHRQDALLVALGWGMSLHADADLTAISARAERLEADDARALAQLDAIQS